MGKHFSLCFGIAVLGVCPSLADAQVILGRGLNSSFASSGAISTPDFSEYEQLTYAQVLVWSSYRLGISTRKGGEVADLYQERVIGTGLTIPIRPQWNLSASYEYSGASGRYAGSSSSGDGALGEHVMDLTAAYKVSQKNTLKFGILDQTSAGTLNSTLLGTSVPILGANPSIGDQIRRTELPIAWESRIGEKTLAQLHASIFQISGHLSSARSDRQGPMAEISMPLETTGSKLGLSVQRSFQNLQLELEGSRESGAKSGTATLNGGDLGPSRFETNTSTFGLVISKNWGRKGKFRIHYENVNTYDQLNVFIPHPSTLGFNVPPAATAFAVGSFASRRTEVGARWTRSSPTVETSIGYRHIYLPFALRGTLYAQDFLFVFSENSSLDYSNVTLGVLEFTRTFHLGRAIVALGVQQIIPFRIAKNDGSGGSGGNTGNPTPSSSIGGTTISVTLSLPIR